MKITKLVHSCLLVEMPEPVNRTVLFDPGSMSAGMVNVDSLKYLDDIVVTHQHSDHMYVPLIKKLVEKFPEVRITAPADAVGRLKDQGITAGSEAPEGMELFDSPHESVEPLWPTPQEIGIHYLNKLSHPGDSHSFNESKEVLALPVQAPWGSTLNAVRLAFKLKPRYVIPIHDWHWSDEACEGMYDDLEQAFQKEGITFLKTKNGVPVVLDI